MARLQSLSLPEELYHPSLEYKSPKRRFSKKIVVHRAAVRALISSLIFIIPKNFVRDYFQPDHFEIGGSGSD